MKIKKNIEIKNKNNFKREIYSFNNKTIKQYFTKKNSEMLSLELVDIISIRTSASVRVIFYRNGKRKKK